MGDFPFLERLSMKYQDIAAESNHWTDYLKVMCNFSMMNDEVSLILSSTTYGLVVMEQTIHIVSILYILHFNIILI